MKTIALWLSYDLGVSGDFQNLYSWLDDHQAIECGNSAAFIKYKYTDDINNDKEFIEYLIKDLKKTINFMPANRFYLIRKSIDKEKTIGSYIVGKRKANPWEGFGARSDETIDE